jgi:glutamate synthase (NADPH/NADH) small chain
VAGREPTPKLSLEKRVKSFEEIKGAYRPQQAVAEAARCLYCDDPPCNKGCPAGIDVLGFIQRIKTKNFVGAYRLIRRENPLGAICSRICPTEELCEKECSSTELNEPIAIADLQRFVTDLELGKGIETPPEKGRGPLGTLRPKARSSGKRVAIIGSGPAGLACAAQLALLGYSPIIFEKKGIPGGILRNGIPEYRLPKKIINKELNYLKKLGVKIKTNALVKNINSPFKKGFEAIFIAIGANEPIYMGIPGENLKGIYTAQEFLRRAKNNPKGLKMGRRVAIIGGGNVAMDSASTALRLKAKEVTIIYRRTQKEMPAWRDEIEEAREEGVSFQFLTLPIRFLGKEKLEGMECIRMRLGKKDRSGRPRPVPIKGSEFSLPVNTVILAIGQRPNLSFSKMNPRLKMDKRGLVVVKKKTQATSLRGVFAGGDAVNGGATVVQAIGEGKKAAVAIDKYLRQG